MTVGYDAERIEAVGDQLRAKISSKFTASTFLGGFALTVATSQVFALWQDNPRLPLLFPVSVGVVLGALIVFVHAIIALDGLTMPKRFWEVDPTAARAPGYYMTDADLWTLHDQMVFIWWRLTMMATCATGAAVLLLLLPWSNLAAAELRIWTFGCAIAGVGLAAAYCCWSATFMAKNFSSLVRAD